MDENVEVALESEDDSLSQAAHPLERRSLDRADGRVE
jgi:hypothetical protein